MNFGACPADIEDDEVVASFNVYASPALVNQAHIFQYPLRRRQRPYEATEIKLFSTSGTVAEEGEALLAHGKGSSVLQPGSRLTMKCSLDTFGSPSFRPLPESAADMLGQMELQRHHTFNYTLQSQPFLPQSNYVLGYITPEGIHLTPVSTIQQFTPALSIPESSTGAVRVAEAFCSQSNSTAMPGFTAADRIQRELRRQRSRVLNEEADTAQEIQFFRDDSVESSAMRSRLRSSTLEGIIGSPNAASEPAKVENSLFPPEILQSGGISGGDEAHPSMIIHRFANRKSVAEQTSQLLQRCHILTLRLLQSIVVPYTSNEVVKTMSTVPEAQLVEALKSCAVWLHGVWVSRYCDQFRGSVAALREVILARFYQSEDGSVARADFNALITTSAARRSIKEILATVAVLNTEEPDPSKRRWRLKYVPEDRAAREANLCDFKANFAAEEASQHEAWRRRCAQVMAHIPYINAGRPVPQLCLRPRGTPPTTGTAASATLPYGGANTAQSIASPVSSMTSGHSGSGVAASASPFSSPASGADLGFKDADIAPIRHYIRELFAEHGVINKQRVKDLVIKAQEARYPHATKAMLSTALQQCLDKFTDATWILKSAGEPIVDYYRPAILYVVLELRQFEMAALMKRLEEVVRARGLTSPPESAALRGRTGGASGTLEAVVQRVVAEVAEFKAGGRLWHIKGGNLMNE
ncbi:Sin-like protein conserved region containing protein [Leishmania donovani]|uniref:Sin-like protein conserved region containing protein, putative n=1 Tax=Leishmania donovani TaxID=5661 RepID=A0A3S7WSL2_LEIDO|nr:Sin-like protein conserved region containing protein, putative [Leishmania donovani]TPP50049.1 Sin-like protein conserved region family protein [Leishmania donovani]CAJ1987229.1 Sin-like protein conserved region containing protein [Leishmania donovani]VDZ43118.1 Sin-like_protein_conserved_region_containing_protein_putative/Pfam:PF04801 [Leishmania donovani]